MTRELIKEWAEEQGYYTRKLFPYHLIINEKIFGVTDSEIWSIYIHQPFKAQIQNPELFNLLKEFLEGSNNDNK